MEAMQVEGLQEPQLPNRWAELADWALNYRPIIRIIVAVLFGCLLSWNIYHWAHKKHFQWCPTTVTVEKDETSGFAGAASGFTRASDFTSISAAVDAAPQNSLKKFCIFIRKGVYHENVLVGREKTNLVFIGEGINKTIIKPKQISGDEVFSTGAPLATLVVKGMGFMAKDLTLESAPGPQTAQTVALENWADQSVFYKCSFVGQNVTLYSYHGLQFYRNCHIQGAQYFISGYAKAVFQQCRVQAVKLLHPDSEENTVISLSQGSPNMITGLVFQRCDFLTIGRVGASSANTYLGGQSDNFATTVVMQSFLDASIAGWLIKNSSCISYHGEYLNTGPGSSNNNRTNSVCIDKINDSYTASQFTVRVFLKGQNWLPSYVPFDLDLV